MSKKKSAINDGGYKGKITLAAMMATRAKERHQRWRLQRQNNPSSDDGYKSKKTPSTTAATKKSAISEGGYKIEMSAIDDAGYKIRKSPLSLSSQT